MERLNTARRLNLKGIPILLTLFFMILSFSTDSFAQRSNGLNRRNGWYNWSGNVNIILGIKNLEENDWKSLNEHNEFGFDADLMHRKWSLSLNLGYLKSYTEAEFSGSEWEARTSEIYVGVKSIVKEIEGISPYIGGGISLTHAELEQKYDFLNSVTSDNEAFGFWLGGGLYFTFIDQINVGFNIRYSYSEVSIFNKKFDAGGLHYGLLCGYHF